MYGTFAFYAFVMLSFDWSGISNKVVEAQSISASTDPDSTPQEGHRVTLKCELFDYRGQVAILWQKMASELRKTIKLSPKISNREHI